jgi:hypothetical protein
MVKWYQVSLLALCLAPSFAQAQELNGDWHRADLATTRLSPNVFSYLPKKIVRALQARGCAIPQAYDETKPHNVVSGEFARKGQTDWAVLCSQNRISSILIFWGGSVQAITAIAKAPDLSYLQGTGNRRLGYSRMIAAVDKKFILDHYKAYGGQKPPPIRHQGIDDGFVGKASQVHYYNGKWLRLQGAD